MCIRRTADVTCRWFAFERPHHAAVLSRPPSHRRSDAKSTAPGSGDLPPRKRRHRPRRAGVAELGVGGQVRASARRPRPRAGGVPDSSGEAIHSRGGSAVHGVVRSGKTEPRVPAGPPRRPAVFAAGERRWGESREGVPGPTCVAQGARGLWGRGRVSFALEADDEMAKDTYRQKDGQTETQVADRDDTNN